MGSDAESRMPAVRRLGSLARSGSTATTGSVASVPLLTLGYRWRRSVPRSRQNLLDEDGVLASVTGLVGLVAEALDVVGGWAVGAVMAMTRRSAAAGGRSRLRPHSTWRGTRARPRCSPSWLCELCPYRLRSTRRRSCAGRLS